MEKVRKIKTFVDEEMMQKLTKAFGGLENVKASHVVGFSGVGIATAEKILSVGYDFKRYKEKYYKEKKQPATQKEMFVEKLKKMTIKNIIKSNLKTVGNLRTMYLHGL